VSRGGAQSLYNITPDLSTFGKIIGGGLPCAAYGGRKEIMEKVAPLGPVYQAGTLSGNPLAMAAGIETLNILSEKGVYETLEENAKTITDGMLEAASAAGFGGKVCLNRVGSMFTLFFCPGPVTNFAEAKHADAALFAKLFRAMLARGVYLAPSQFEAAFVSLPMDRRVIKKVKTAAQGAFKEIEGQHSY
jgi:glutamate-1-semialdehyde 2,1-aminomutase